MITDATLEIYPATVVNNTSVNPIPADGYISLLTNGVLGTYLIASQPNGGALWKINRPYLPNTGKLSLSFNWILSTEALLYGRCFEFDTRPTDQAGWTYPCDFQFILQSNALYMYVATGVAAGKIQWQSTGSSLPLPAAGMWTWIGIDYALDTVKHVCSILEVSNGSLKIPIPANLQNQPAVQIGWQAGTVTLQKQLVNGPAAGAFSDGMKNIQYAWN